MLAGALVLGYSTAPIYWLLPYYYQPPWVLVVATFLGAIIGGTVAKHYWRNAAAT